MTHLTTEELLEHFDGELNGESSAHIDRCAACQQSMAELQSWLYEVEQDIRASVPAEVPELRVASRERLQETLYPAKPVIAFPVRWAPAYAVAAGLAIAALGGYMALRAPNSAVPVQVVEGVAIESAVPAVPAAESVVTEPVKIAVVPEPAPVQMPRAAAARPADAASAQPVEIAASVERSTPPARFEMARLELATPATRASRPFESQATFSQAPALSISRSLSFAGALMHIAPVTLDLPLALQPQDTLVASAPAEAAPQAAPISADEAPFVLAGHHILNKTGVWQEDIRPFLTGGVLSFRGTVENAAVRERVTAEIQRAAGERLVSFALIERQTGDTEALLAGANQSTDARASGGVVRSSLLSHYGDAARRSFQAPEPAALESELDRYVSDVLRGQSRLLSHVYALNGVLTSFDASLVSRLGRGDVDSFRQVVSFHTTAIREHEASIYDRLSEALPRRFWTYRADKDEAQGDSDWRRESQLLLSDTLDLDATLNALLVTPETSIDTSDVNLSCGELLGRIRTRISHLEAPIQALQ